MFQKTKKPSSKKTGRQKDAVPPEFAENDALNFSLTQRKTDILPNTDSAATFCKPCLQAFTKRLLSEKLGVRTLPHHSHYCYYTPKISFCQDYF